MVAPIVSGHADSPVKFRGAQQGIGHGDKSIVLHGAKFLLGGAEGSDKVGESRRPEACWWCVEKSSRKSSDS